MKDDIAPLIIVGSMVMSALAGWIMAHATVATECEKLGGFYVGNSIYTCQKAKNDSTN